MIEGHGTTIELHLHGLNTESRATLGTSRPVEVVLMGGLGNQLFQWGTGYGLAERLGTGLKMNTTMVGSRNYELGRLNIPAPILSDKQLVYYNLNPTLKRIYRVLNKRNEYFEKPTTSQSQIWKFSYPKRLHGYFHSYEYVLSAIETLSKEDEIVIDASKDYLEYKNKLKEIDFIALHVRRGDYLTNQSFYPLLKKDYYNEALKEIPRSKRNSLVVFSDDIDQARQEIPGADIYLGQEIISSPLETLSLMREASALVGANSTFSLWAGFLLRRESYVRIFPKNWYGPNALIEPPLLPLSYKRV